jgi:small subunit ribosomal protein S7
VKTDFIYRTTMPRGQFFGHREAQPLKYRDKLVGKFLNVLMGGGKKSTAERDLLWGV